MTNDRSNKLLPTDSLPAAQSPISPSPPSSKPILPTFHHSNCERSELSSNFTLKWVTKYQVLCGEFLPWVNCRL
jgi:hypothetical protein